MNTLCHNKYNNKGGMMSLNAKDFCKALKHCKNLNVRANN